MRGIRIHIIILFLVIAGINNGFGQVTYPGGEQAADIPQLFAKDILSDGLSKRDFTISPQGDEIFFTIQGPRFSLSTILHMTKKSGKWTGPEVAPFSGRWRDLEATFSLDGQWVYFSSDRPLNGDTRKDFDIWRVRRSAEGKWGEPENLGPDVNSPKDEFYPSITRSGNLYFTAELPHGKGSEDIVVCKPNGNGFDKPESLPENINTKFDEFNAFVDPDEQFIIFSSYGRPDDMGGGDLYISRKNKNGDWLPVKHLAAPLNSPYLDCCPYVTPDRKYLVFTSNRMSKAFTNGKIRNYSEIKTILTSPGNGQDDIYWVKFNTGWLK